MERNVHLNWEVIVRQARKRRKERGLTQQHLAALANVGRSTLNRFENQKGDVTLWSVLRILGVLDMLDRKQEGTLRVKASETQSAHSMSRSHRILAATREQQKLWPAAKPRKNSFRTLVHPKKHRSVQSVRPIAGEVDPSPVCR